MDEFFKILRIINIYLLYALAIKTIIGYKFPWEVCSCCKKKIRDHKKE